MPAACILEFSEFVNQNVHALLDDAALRLAEGEIFSRACEGAHVACRTDLSKRRRRDCFWRRPDAIPACMK